MNILLLKELNDYNLKSELIEFLDWPFGLSSSFESVFT